MPFKASFRGISHGSRAKAEMFTKEGLAAKPNAYPAIGQKKLSGASSRLMLHFARTLAAELLAQNPTDVNRLGVCD